MIRRILLPIDQLDPVNPVLRAAYRHFQGAELHLLHVLTPSLPLAAHGGFLPIPPDPAFSSAAQARAEEALSLLGPGEVVVSSNVAGEILRRASQDFDVMLMGTAGKTGLARLLLGSVAEAVIRDSAIPVMTVRQVEDDAPPMSRPFLRGLLLTDFSPWSEWAQAYLSHSFPETAWQNLHVVPEEGVAYLPMSMTGAHLPSDYSQERLHEAEQRLAQQGGGEAKLGDPARVILQRAGAGEIDIVAIGTQPRGPLERLLYGPVAAQVIRESPVPVLIARSRPFQ